VPTATPGNAVIWPFTDGVSIIEAAIVIINNVAIAALRVFLDFMYFYSPFNL
jgi:hypothetical protein